MSHRFGHSDVDFADFGVPAGSVSTINSDMRALALSGTLEPTQRAIVDPSGLAALTDVVLTGSPVDQPSPATAGSTGGGQLNGSTPNGVDLSGMGVAHEQPNTARGGAHEPEGIYDAKTWLHCQCSEFFFSSSQKYIG